MVERHQLGAEISLWREGHYRDPLGLSVGLSLNKSGSACKDSKRGSSQVRLFRTEVCDCHQEIAISLLKTPKEKMGTSMIKEMGCTEAAA